jgi:hypothetical protein
MREFHQLFAGRDDVYGTYAISGVDRDKGEKRTGKAKTVIDTEVTVELYEKHLDGEQSLGVVPIRLDGTVSWFAIDVDNYGDDKLHSKLAHKIDRLDLPLLVFKSKSGGAHLFCFLIEPAQAGDVREHALKYVKALGLPKTTEIFPKQEAIVRSDAGSWINLPYFGDTRPCLSADGKTELSLKEFRLLAADREVHPSDLGFKTKALETKDTSGEADVDGGAPPCIVTMLNDGIEEGGRDNAMTHIAVFMKKAYPDDWQEKLMEVNEEGVHPPLPTSEMFRVIKSAERKDYQYLCKQTPMSGICDKTSCLKRKFGVGDGESGLANFHIDSIRKIGAEEPYYIVVVDGTPIRLQTEELLTFRKFEVKVFEAINKIIRPFKPMEWKEFIADITANIEVEVAPEEVSTSGAVRNLFMNWTEQRLNGVRGDLSRVGDGQPFFDGKQIFFRGTDFLSYVRRNANSIIDNRLIWLSLSEDGAEEKRVNINGRDMKVWTFPVGEPWFNPKDQSEGAF